MFCCFSFQILKSNINTLKVLNNYSFTLKISLQLIKNKSFPYHKFLPKEILRSRTNISFLLFLKLDQYIVSSSGSNNFGRVKTNIYVVKIQVRFSSFLCSRQTIFHTQIFVMIFSQFQVACSMPIWS